MRVGKKIGWSVFLLVGLRYNNFVERLVVSPVVRLVVRLDGALDGEPDALQIVLRRSDRTFLGLCSAWTNAVLQCATDSEERNRIRAGELL